MEKFFIFYGFTPVQTTSFQFPRV